MDDGRVDVFFYGLFMDRAVLAEQDVLPTESRQACVCGYALQIGQRARLVPTEGARAYGMVHSLTRTELNRLYGRPGLEAYRPEAIVVRNLDGTSATAICYNLPATAHSGEANAEYAAQLRDVLIRLGLPQDGA